MKVKYVIFQLYNFLEQYIAYKACCKLNLTYISLPMLPLRDVIADCDLDSPHLKILRLQTIHCVKTNCNFNFDILGI